MALRTRLTSWGDPREVTQEPERTMGLQKLQRAPVPVHFTKEENEVQRESDCTKITQWGWQRIWVSRCRNTLHQWAEIKCTTLCLSYKYSPEKNLEVHIMAWNTSIITESEKDWLEKVKVYLINQIPIVKHPQRGSKVMKHFKDI